MLLTYLCIKEDKYITYIILGLVKILDNIISTAKSIATYKEAKVISSILTILSQLLFYLVISKVISDNTLLCIIIVSISSGIGNYIAFTINEKYKKDEKWTMVITCSDISDILDLCKYLREHDIKHIANHGINKKGKETIHVIAFSKTKYESKLIKNFINNSNYKYLVEII